MKASEGHAYHNVWIGFNKVVKCLCYLISAFGPFEVCVAFFICLLHRKRSDYTIIIQNVLNYQNRHLSMQKPNCRTLYLPI